MIKSWQNKKSQERLLGCSKNACFFKKRMSPFMPYGWMGRMGNCPTSFWQNSNAAAVVVARHITTHLQVDSYAPVLFFKKNSASFPLKKVDDEKTDGGRQHI